MDFHLRPVEPGDLEKHYEYQADPQALRMGGVPGRERDDFMAHWRRILADESSHLRTIVASGAVAGHVTSWRDGDRRMVGYWIGREFWGRGLATRALAALLAEVDERPLFAHVASDNVASMRVLEKCGFVRTEEPVPDGFGYTLRRNTG